MISHIVWYKISGRPLSAPVDDRFLLKMKEIQVNTIIRYYDWEMETIRGKTLFPRELKRIHDNGMKIAVIFQHNNDKMATFENLERGTVDARRALQLAKLNKQPAGSAIYFGVDGVDDRFLGEFLKRKRSGKDRYGLALIKNYFQRVNKEISTSGFDVGAYGSGLVCKELLTQRLVRYCWLANARSWPGYDEFEKTKLWSLKQHVETRNCGGRNVDLNVVNPEKLDFGQWVP
jgi:hypothetical protein